MCACVCLSVCVCVCVCVCVPECVYVCVGIMFVCVFVIHREGGYCLSSCLSVLQSQRSMFFIFSN